jgi:protein-S-isoprenylcysteine O-methyltransferase Ste14
METSTSARRDGLRWFLRPEVLDRLEQITILVLWFFLLRRMLLSPNHLAPLALLSETSIAFFVLIRRPTGAISINLGDWMLATTATAAPMLVQPSDAPGAPIVAAGVALLVAGTCLHILAKLYLRRSFGIAPANRGIKIDGPYKLVRHPMYSGYLLTHVGIFLMMPTIFNAVIYVIGWTAQVLRLLAEERLLAEDASYCDYLSRVRWHLIPGIF